jgi:hypothetical protein
MLFVVAMEYVAIERIPNSDEGVSSSGFAVPFR